MNKLTNLTILVCLTLSSFYVQDVLSQNIFPGSVGFGTDSRGAYELYEQTGDSEDLPIILIVDTNDGGSFSTGTNRGTLRWALTRNYPRIVVFEVGGTIDCSSVGGDYQQLLIENPYMSVYGQTAPYPGVTVIGAKLHFQKNHDVLIQHLKLRPAVTPETAGKEVDCLGGWGGNHHIVVDHCSFSWSIDELAGFNPANDVTFSNCIFAEAFNCNTHPTPGDECHSMGNTFLNVTNISLIGNLYTQLQFRAPFFNSENTNIFYANNYINNVGQYGLYMRDSYNTNTASQVSVVGNYYKPGTNTFNSQSNLVALHSTLSSSSNIYLKDNYHPSTTNQTSAQMVKNDAGATLQTNRPNVEARGYVPYSSSMVPDSVTNYAGAFYWDRDSTDIRIIKDVINGTGSIIDNVDEIGKTFLDIETKGSLTIPDNPHLDDNNNGFTNIEDWAFDLASLVDKDCNGFRVAGVVKNSDSGMDNGEISVSITGGTPMFNYLWNDNSTELNRSDLAPGDYTLQVTDSKGCVASGFWSVIELGGGNDNGLIKEYSEIVVGGIVQTIDYSMSEFGGEDVDYLWVVPEDLGVSSLNGDKISYLPPVVEEEMELQIIVEITDGEDVIVDTSNVLVRPYDNTKSQLRVTNVDASSFDDTNIPKNVLDGDLKTRWSAEGVGEEIVFTLEEASNISHITTSFYNCNSRIALFNVSASTDSTQWDDVLINLRSSGFCSNFHLYTLSDDFAWKEYKYVRLIGYGNTSNLWNSYTEINIFGNIGSIADESKAKVEIFPNPVVDFMNIKIEEKSDMEVFNIYGKKVFNKRLEMLQEQIELNFSPGTYIVKITSGNKRHSQKIQVQ